MHGVGGTLKHTVAYREEGGGQNLGFHCVHTLWMASYRIICGHDCITDTGLLSSLPTLNNIRSSHMFNI